MQATPITSGTVTLATGWYSIKGEISNDNRLRVANRANVNIILEQDACFTNPKGITCNEGSKLTIWAQTKDAGTWIINDPSHYNAAIGGEEANSGVNTINGGVIKANANVEPWFQPGSSTFPLSAAIGGCGGYPVGTTGTVVINGGVIEADGGYCAAAIGGGCYAPGNVTINGGTITARGSSSGVYTGEKGYGIGGGYGSTGSTVTLNYNDYVSIQSNNYNGTVTFLKTFYDGSRIIEPCVLEDGTGLDDKTLVPGGIFAALCDDNKTLYFAHAGIPVVGGKYKGQTVTAVWLGDDVTNTPVDDDVPGWDGADYRNNITSVVFDPSFADVRPKSTACWFREMGNLISVTGLEYLNTSQVTSMYRMFYSCYYLTSLDLSNFDLSNLTRSSFMFFQCVRLTTLYSNADWKSDKLADSERMFYHCSKLKGAVEYNSRNENDATQANPTMDMGYFTGKWALNIPSSFDHGTITCEKDWAYTNETVTLTINTENGYELEDIIVTTVDDEPSGAPSMVPRRLEIGVIPGDEPDTYIFTMPAAPVTIDAFFSEHIVTGVENLNAAQSNAGQRYNLMGQPVGKDYKGIVIEDGKKRVIK